MADGGKLSALPAGAIAAAGQRLAGWLAGPALAETGDGGLAVLARREADGGACLAYPEVAGYFLQFLAAGGLPVAVGQERAVAILAWLRHWMGTGGATRPALPGLAAQAAAADDWRNGGGFLFDDAILLRGLAAAETAGLLTATATAPVRAALLQRLTLLLDRQGELRACRTLGTARLPARWSTRRGPFLLKAVAALHLAGPLPAELAAAVARLDARWQRLPADPHRDCPHAALYAVEGARLLGRHAAVPVRLPARLRQAPRLDQLAQWLRLCLLDGIAADAPALRPAWKRLLAAQRGDGGLPFAESPGDSRANTWASLFAWQACDFHRRAEAGESLAGCLPCLI